MKDDTQATHLSKIIQKQKCYPEYELALPFSQIKKSHLKKLSRHDIILLGLEDLSMILLSNGNICATAIMKEDANRDKIKITKVDIDTSSKIGKKYKLLKCSFGTVQSRKIEAGHKIDVASVNFNKVILSVESRDVAKGFLVNVDGEIAIQIDKTVTG